MTTEERAEALWALIELRQPIEDSVGRLRAFPWDSEDVLVTVGAEAIGRILDHYLAGSLAEADLEMWANAIEGRDDVAYDPSNEEALKRVIFECANPILSGPITPDKARQWKQDIQGSSTI